MAILKPKTLELAMDYAIQASREMWQVGWDIEKQVHRYVKGNCFNFPRICIEGKSQVKKIDCGAELGSLLSQVAIFILSFLE